MGLRYASVRQPHVVVMAPALTETGQPQGFPLKSGTLSSPVSLIFNDNSERAIKCNAKCLENIKGVSATVGMNGDFEKLAELTTVPSTRCSNRLVQDEKDTVDTCEVSDPSIVKESDYSLLQIGGFMMSNSCTSTGNEDNMGFQKSSSQLSNLDSCNYLKMDLFKSLNSTTLPQSDAVAGSDLGHNVEEIMQVIKNMESKGTDIEENLDPSLQINDGHDIAGSLSTFEREFLNDVAMMCVDENLSDNGLAIENKNTVFKDKVSEAQERQFRIERKCEWLLRRLHKMRARAVGKHSSEEVIGLLQHISDLLEDTDTPTNCSPLYSALTSGKEDTLKTSREVSRHISSLTALVKRLDQSSQQQALASSQHHLPCKYFGSGSCENVSSVSKQNHPALTVPILPKFSREMRKEVEEVSGHLQLQLKVINHGIDSDATASSSGGESCDELQHFNNQHQQSLSISKRASWRWAKDRVAIGSRWSWLQAQISEMDYRIRQTNELQKQLRTGKGGVNLAGDDPPKVSDSVVLNGYHSALPGTTNKNIDDELTTESVCRTRPLMRSSFRKRKLFHTAGLHLTNKKVAKPSLVPCGCYPPLNNCVLCTGRSNPTIMFEDVDLLTVNERIGLLDPAFHPVLSFPSEVSQSLHFDAVMKTTDWQMKCHRLQLKTPTLLRVLEQAEDNSDCSETVLKNSQKSLLEHRERRRYFRRSTATALSERSASPEDRDSESQQMDEDGYSESASPVVVVSGASRPSPAPSPTPHCSKDRGEAYRRKRENSYDIDNIVIPYSVAASTRLEKLQYKEILTPKWRVHPVEPLPKLETKNSNGLIRRPSQEDGDAEDLTEEMLANRHERCEQEEKKKFSTYLKLPNSLGRPRVHRRADSRAESSGGNTPDPMSPAGPDVTGEAAVITSPPTTPQPSIGDKDSVAAEDRYSIRRRTISSRCASPAEGCHDEVAPYDLRTFPLTDETYEKMLKVMPPGHPFKSYPSSHQNEVHDSHDSEGESRPITPLSDSTESADTLVEDDPNDPEWTVDESSSERPPFKR